MKKLVLFLILAVVLFGTSGCEVQRPTIKKISNFNSLQFKDGKLSFSIDVTAYNPNDYKIKVRRSKLDLFINESYVGKIQLLKKVKLGKKSTSTNAVPVSIELDKKILKSLLNVALGKNAEIRLEGPLKLSVGIFPVRKKINESKRIDLHDWGLDVQKIIQLILKWKS